MKWAAIVLVLLAGCAAQTQVRVGSGSSVSQSSVQLHVEGGRGLAALLGLSILAAGIYEMERNGSPQFAGELAPDRRVVEQDCTRPLVDLSANLKCR